MQFYTTLSALIIIADLIRPVRAGHAAGDLEGATVYADGEEGRCMNVARKSL